MDGSLGYTQPGDELDWMTGRELWKQQCPSEGHAIDGDVIVITTIYIASAAAGYFWDSLHFYQLSALMLRVT